MVNLHLALLPDAVYHAITRLRTSFRGRILVAIVARVCCRRSRCLRVAARRDGVIRRLRNDETMDATRRSGRIEGDWLARDKGNGVFAAYDPDPARTRSGAVEAVAIPVVLPHNAKATLSTVSGVFTARNRNGSLSWLGASAFRAQPRECRSRSSRTWPRYCGWIRVTGTHPYSRCPPEAEMVVHLTPTLVQVLTQIDAFPRSGAHSRVKRADPTTQGRLAGVGGGASATKRRWFLRRVPPGEPSAPARAISGPSGPILVDLDPHGRQCLRTGHIHPEHLGATTNRERAAEA